MLPKLFKKRGRPKKIQVEETNQNVCEVDLNLRNKLIKSIAHPNKIKLGLALLECSSTEAELIEEFGMYRVEEMKRHISKLQGKGWVCKACYKR